MKYDAALATDFFGTLRQLTPAPVVCEPRHATWFTPEADALLTAHHVAQVAADPAIVPQAAHPGGWAGLSYYRWHGSPRKYYSAYTPESLHDLAKGIQRRDGDVWVIFDNTAGGEAAGNGLDLITLTAGA
ncbi:hypothetical protein GCM10017782_14200 [Deinococcus ficus]|nr:DUF72 domain-containing protein [Deinococcus ficus]GHF77255.1 hypothetical protein GCM10017782_14200 [Deinococcus ficus]